MAELIHTALQEFYKNELKFTPGCTVSVFRRCGEYTYSDVQSLRVVCPVPGVEFLVFETSKQKFLFRKWEGVSIKHASAQAQLQLSG